MRRLTFYRFVLLAVSLIFTVPGIDAMATGPDENAVLELSPLQVTATRLAEPADRIPASITVISGEELALRHAYDLRSAMALVAGVDIAPGGDSGPAAAVPGMWGLREFDAFLLVVDGVPWGGAFNPALSTLVLTDVDRIEVLRGAAPVMYGATSFVGVIHVIHRAAGESGRNVRISYGRFDSAAVSASMALPAGQRYRQSLAVDGERSRFSDDRAGVDRGHVLYRGGFVTDRGAAARFDFDVSRLRQDPASPHLREGPVLAPGLPLDANHNPSDARLDEDRYHLVGAYDRPLEKGSWSTLLALTSSSADIIRGFLDEEYVDDGSSPNAAGFIQDRDLRDLYFDSHVVQQLGDALQLTLGLDYLYGRAEQTSENFDYYVPASGMPAPGSGLYPIGETFRVVDERNFLGAYLQAQWDLTPAVDLLAGIRLNHTDESRHSEGPAEDSENTDSDQLDRMRLSGMMGFSWRVWQQDSDFFTIFADYRDTFKPAAMDFGPESEAEILQPEKAHSFEAGFRSSLLAGRMDISVSAFDMRFENLIVSQSVNGRPGLTNAGEEHFKGAEAEARLQLAGAFAVAGSYAWHEARFADYVQLFGNTPTQLDGNYLEMSPRHLASLGLDYHPRRGLRGSMVWQHAGSRYLNKRNTAIAPSYDTLDASLGWRFEHLEIAAGAHNLTDTRPPVSESELGESQYYRLPARSYELIVTWLF